MELKTRVVFWSCLVITGIAVVFMIVCWIYRPRLFLLSESEMGGLWPCDPSATTTTNCLPLPAPEPPFIPGPVQSGKIDEHLTIDNTLRDVNFCGKIYRVKQVLIDEVDVVQRIAELATAEVLKSEKLQIENSFCKYLSDYMYTKKINTGDISNEIETSAVSTYLNDTENKIYVAFIANSGFQINSATQEIFQMSAIGDAPIFIGNLK